MTDENNTPTSVEGEMPEAQGDNFNRVQKELGREAYKIGRHAESLLNRHDKIVALVHADIIAFGLKLQTGRDLYEFDDLAYGDWVIRNKLDTVRIGETQQERTACRTIARLHETGYVEDPDAENGATLKLDLTQCKRVRPTDIVKWARGCQPLLFDDLRAKASRPKKSKTPDLPSDDVPDLGASLSELEVALDRVGRSLKTVSDDDVASAIKKIEELLKMLKKRQKPAG